MISSIIINNYQISDLGFFLFFPTQWKIKLKIKYNTKKIENNIFHLTGLFINIIYIIISCKQIPFIDERNLKNIAIQLPSLFSYEQL